MADGEVEQAAASPGRLPGDGGRVQRRRKGFTRIAVLVKFLRYKWRPKPNNNSLKNPSPTLKQTCLLGIKPRLFKTHIKFDLAW